MTHANKITAIKAIEPARVCKTYALNGDELRKTAIAHITAGVGYTREVETSQDLIKILKAVTDKLDLAIMPGEFHGDNAQPFKIISEPELANAVNSAVGAVEPTTLEDDGLLWMTARAQYAGVRHTAS